MGKHRMIKVVSQSLYLQMDLESLLEHDLTMQVIVMQIDRGHVRIFKYQVISGTATWTQVGADIDGEGHR